MYKFMWNGIKDTETKELVKCWYSKGNILKNGVLAKRNIKCYEKSVERCIKNAEIYKGLPAGAYYLKHLETYQNGLRLQKEYLENLQRGAI